MRPQQLCICKQGVETKLNDIKTLFQLIRQHQFSQNFICVQILIATVVIKLQEHITTKNTQQQISHTPFHFGEFIIQLSINPFFYKKFFKNPQLKLKNKSELLSSLAQIIENIVQIQMRQSVDIGKLQFSKLPYLTSRPSEEKNSPSNDYYFKPSSNKRVTFGARLTNLSSSTVSLISSTSSLGYKNNLTLSRTSFDSQIPTMTQSQATFREIQNQNLINRQNQDPGMILLRKTQSSKEEQNDPNMCLKKYKEKPILKQSIIVKRNIISQPYGLQKDDIIKKLAQRQDEIRMLKQQLQSQKKLYEQKLNQKQETQSIFQHSISELNQIIFQLRNTKQNQAEIIGLLEEQIHKTNLDNNSLSLQNKGILEKVKNLECKNQKLQSVLEHSKGYANNQNVLAKSELRAIQFQNQISELQKSVNHQSNKEKNLRTDLKKNEDKVMQLQKFIQNSNNDVMKDMISMLNQSLGLLQEIE